MYYFCLEAHKIFSLIDYTYYIIAYLISELSILNTYISELSYINIEILSASK